MSQFCFICNKLLTEDKIVVVDRGMPNLIEASVARGDEFTEYVFKNSKIRYNTRGLQKIIHPKNFNFCSEKTT